MKTIKIGGVPEHFNLPWHLSIEDATFKKQGLQLNWTDFPGGTGAMCNALREEKLDVAIILTEGIIKDIVQGNPAVIVQEYVASPLIWSVHVAQSSNYKSLEDLKGKKVAISRYGSGSHLMACVNAKNLGWDPTALDFVEVNSLQGGIAAMNLGKADYFLWEHFTTKPLVDQGLLRRLGDCPTPWPCFVIAVRRNFAEKKLKYLQKMLSVINSTASNFKKIPAIETVLAKKYGQKIVDVEAWLKLTHWSQKQISVREIEKVQTELLELNLIPKKLPKHRFTDYLPLN